MLNLSTSTAPIATRIAAADASGDTETAATLRTIAAEQAADTAEREAAAKPAKRAKRASKPAAPKAAKPAPAPVATPAAPASNVADERRAAAAAVSAFYSAGPSFPFKSASVKLSDVNAANAKAPSVRTAAMLAAMLAYAGDNIKPNGDFVRGGFRVPAKLINPDAKPGDMLAAMPESGCLGNVLGRCITHVSGPLGGKQARDGIFRLNFDAVRSELAQLGDATAKPALAVLNKLAPAKPAKRAA